MDDKLNSKIVKKQDNVSNDSQIVKCKTCGADMVFDVTKGKLICPYCDREDDISANIFETEHTLDGFDETKLKHEDGSITYQCPNCHAKTVMHEFGTSAKCPFCGATNILTVDELPGLAPDAILPFTISREQAVAMSRKWVKTKIFAPSKLKKTFTPENMNPLYVPAFTFDSATSSDYEGRLGKDYTVTVGSGKDKHIETRTDWKNVEGNFNLNFDDILVEASATLNQYEIEQVGAFDIKNAVEYKYEYIAGMSSERHNIGVNKAFEIAKEKMTEDIKQSILSQYDCDKVDYLNINTKYAKNTFKHLLVPLWCCAFKFKEKLYKYLVNGRSGRVDGKSPLSPIKVTLAVLAAIAVGVIVYFIFFK
ncbi:MAG: hypothetical protein RR357_00020 [Clostridia bacterium]